MKTEENDAISWMAAFLGAAECAAMQMVHLASVPSE
jgi:hypothetical protein